MQTGPVHPAAARRSALVLATAALLFSGMALFAKAAARHLPGPEVASVRFLLGLCIALAPLVAGRRLHPVNHRSLLLRGVFGSGAVLLYFQAIAHLPVGIATLLNNSWPVFGGLFAFLFLREPMTRRAVLALALTFVGVLLVVIGSTPAGLSLRLGSHDLGWGLCGLASAVLSGAAVTTVRSMRQSEGSWEIFVAFCLVGSLVTAVPAALSWVTPTLTDGIWLLAMGACAAAAQLGMTYSLRDLPAVTSGIILQLTPIATLLLGVVLFTERPTPLGWLGALLTILGVTWGTTGR